MKVAVTVLVGDACVTSIRRIPGATRDSTASVITTDVPTPTARCAGVGAS